MREQKAPGKRNIVSRKIDEGFDKLHKGIERLAERSVNYLDKNYYHLSTEELTRDRPISSDREFEKLKSERFFYALQEVTSGIGGLASFLLGGITFLAAVSSIGRSAGYLSTGEEMLASQQYWNAMGSIGISFLQFETARFLAYFTESTTNRFETLKYKTERYALMNGPETTTLK